MPGLAGEPSSSQTYGKEQKGSPPPAVFFFFFTSEPQELSEWRDCCLCGAFSETSLFSSGSPEVQILQKSVCTSTHTTFAVESHGSCSKQELCSSGHPLKVSDFASLYILSFIADPDSFIPSLLNICPILEAFRTFPVPDLLSACGI